MGALVDAGASFGQLGSGPTALASATGELDGGFQRARLDLDPFNIEFCSVFSDAPAAFRRAFVVIMHVAATAKPAAGVLRCCNGCHAPL